MKNKECSRCREIHFSRGTHPNCRKCKREVQTRAEKLLQHYPEAIIDTLCPCSIYGENAVSAEECARILSCTKCRKAFWYEVEK